MSKTEEDIYYARLAAAENRARMLRRNPAPTVPQYDLQKDAAKYWWSFYSYGFANTTEMTGPGNYTIETHYDITNLLCTGYLNGIQVNQFNITDPALKRSIVMGWIFAFENGYQDANGNVSDSRMHFELRNFMVGTTRHGTDLWNDNLSTVPTIPPYYAEFINSPHMNPITISGDTWLSVDYIDTADHFVSFRNNMPGVGNDTWWQFDIHISDEFFSWLGSANVFGGIGNVVDIGEWYTSPTSGDTGSDPPIRIGAWYGIPA